MGWTRTDEYALQVARAEYNMWASQHGMLFGHERKRKASLATKIKRLEKRKAASAKKNASRRGMSAHHAREMSSPYAERMLLEEELLAYEPSPRVYRRTTKDEERERRKREERLDAAVWEQLRKGRGRRNGLALLNYTKAQQAIIHEKAMLLVEEGYPHRQAHAIAASMMKAGRLTPNLEYVRVSKKKPKKKATGSSAAEVRKARKAAESFVKPSRKSSAKTRSRSGLHCSKCGKDFKSATGLAWHRENIH